jgi:hypothetical protein
MEDILLNIDSKYRNTLINPSESKFKIILDKTYKNIASVKIASIELNNCISYLDSDKKNNFFILHFPNKLNDPEGIIFELPKSLYQIVTPIQTIFNNIMTSKVNGNQKLENLAPERYFYIFYLNDNVTIDIRTLPLNTPPTLDASGNYTGNNFTVSNNLTIKTGWYSLYGLTNIINNFVLSLKSPYNIFNIQEFTLRVFDRRLRNTITPADDNIRKDRIFFQEFLDTNLSINLQALKTHIYKHYIKDTIKFMVQKIPVPNLVGFGILDKLVTSTYVIDPGYIAENQILKSGSKYHISSNKVGAPTDDDIQLYNLYMDVDLTKLQVSIKNTFTDNAEIACSTQFYYYYIDSLIQTWDKIGETGLQDNTFESLLGKSQLELDDIKQNEEAKLYYTHMYNIPGPHCGCTSVRSCTHYCSHTCIPGVCIFPCTHPCTTPCWHISHTCTHTCTISCSNPCTNVCNHPKPDNINKNIIYTSTNLFKDIPDFEINFNTFDSEPTYNGQIFDIKKLRYPNLGFYLGYRKPFYTSTIEDTDKVIRPEKVFNTIGDNYLFIKINDWGHLDFYSQKVFGKILLTSGMGNPKLDEYVSKEYKFNQPINFQTLNIELIDYLGNTVDMNGFDFSFTLEMKQILDSGLKNNMEYNFNNFKKM